MSAKGTVASGYESVRTAFVKAQEGDPGGAQLAVYRHGVKVVDLCIGSDPIRDRAFDNHGLIVTASVTKGLTATIAHLLLQRRLLDIDAPVAKYWPEFAQNGKEDITVKMVLTHTAGLAAFSPDADMRMSDMADWKKAINAIEKMAPFWEPGTKRLYHPWTFGFLMGEIVQRITGKTIGRLFHEEVAVPLGLDLWIGLPDIQADRVILWLKPSRAGPQPEPQEADGTPIPAKSPSAVDTSDPLVAAYLPSLDSNSLIDFFNSHEGQACECPGTNAIGDARSLAKMYANLIGPVDGIPRLLSQETLERAVVPQSDGVDVVSPFDLIPAFVDMRFALGYAGPHPFSPMLGPTSFGHVGSGGCLAIADIESGISLGYVCNNPVWDASAPDPRWLPWLAALREVAGKNL